MKKSILIALLMPVVVAVAFLYWKGSMDRWITDLCISVLPVALMTAGIFVKKSAPKRYGFEMLAPFVWVGVFSIAGIMPLATIIAFMTLPIAIACAQTMKKISEGAHHLFSDLDERTARLQIMFSSLLAVSFVVAHFL